jgi:hypothetical protein
MGEQPWPELELHGRHHGDLPERGERGEGENERGRGWVGALEGGCCAFAALCVWLPVCAALHDMREVEEEREKEREKKRKIKEIFSKPRNFWVEK